MLLPISLKSVCFQFYKTASVPPSPILLDCYLCPKNKIRVNLTAIFSLRKMKQFTFSWGATFREHFVTLIGHIPSHERWLRDTYWNLRRSNYVPWFLDIPASWREECSFCLFRQLNLFLSTKKKKHIYSLCRKSKQRTSSVAKTL